jgi:seryl-tRNA synthetase
LDERRRQLLPRVEERRAEQNRVSEQIAEAKREGGEPTEQIAAMRELAAEIKSLEQELAGVEKKSMDCCRPFRISPTRRRPTAKPRTTPRCCAKSASAPCSISSRGTISTSAWSWT